MILKAFKEKSNKKYINTVLSSRRANVDNSRVERLGIILNLDEFSDYEMMRKMAETLNIRPNRLKIVGFTSNKNTPESSWDTCFTPKDFGWSGKVNHVELEEFLNTKFDALISYYTDEALELKLITAKSAAKFKIGILQQDERLNDLIIKTGIKDVDTFRKELKKYLITFNKLNVE